jgi:hypothetical protein
MPKFLPDVIRLFIFLSILVYGNFLFNQTHSEYRAVEKEFIEYLLELEDSIAVYQSLLEKKPRVIVVQNTTNTLQIDTVRTNSTGENLNKVYEIPFDLIDRKPGSFFEIEGITKFKWDYLTNRPYQTTTELLDSKISLNVETSFSVENDLLTLDVFSPYQSIQISYVAGNVVDLNKIHKPKPARWGIGLVGGYGITNKGVTPYLGLGITYSFKQLK